MLATFLRVLLCFSILINSNTSEETQNGKTENQAEEDNPNKQQVEEPLNKPPEENNHMNGEHQNGEQRQNGELKLNGENHPKGEAYQNGEHNLNGERKNLNGEQKLNGEQLNGDHLNGELNMNGEYHLNGEHNLNGEHTYCSHTASPVPHTNIYRGDYDFLNHNYKLATAFVNNSVTPFVRIGSEVSQCETSSPLGCTRNCWQDRVNPKHLYEMLNHHCFYIDHDIGDSEPVRALFKVIHHPDLQFIGHQLMYVVPRQYLVFDKYSDLWDVCNSVSVGQMGEFADAVIVKSFNLTEILQHMKKRFNRG